MRDFCVKVLGVVHPGRFEPIEAITIRIQVADNHCTFPNCQCTSVLQSCTFLSRTQNLKPSALNPRPSRTPKIESIGVSRGLGSLKLAPLYLKLPRTTCFRVGSQYAPYPKP